MTGDIFFYTLLVGIIGGVIWSISVKVREFSSFVKKNGWHPVKKKIFDFFLMILHVIIYSIIGAGYLSGFVLIPLYFDWMLENEDYTNTFIVTYLFLGMIAFYYVNGIKRKNTKNLINILSQDFTGFKNGIKEFVQEVFILIKALLVLSGWLVAIFVGIGVIVLGIWLIVAIGPLWIIAIVLILILLAMAGR